MYFVVNPAFGVLSCSSRHWMRIIATVLHTPLFKLKHCLLSPQNFPQLILFLMISKNFAILCKRYTAKGIEIAGGKAEMN